MGKSLWSKGLQRRLVRCRASLRALCPVGMVHAVPTAPGAQVMHQPLVCGMVVLVLLVAVCLGAEHETCQILDESC